MVKANGRVSFFKSIVGTARFMRSPPPPPSELLPEAFKAIAYARQKTSPASINNAGGWLTAGIWKIRRAETSSLNAYNGHTLEHWYKAKNQSASTKARVVGSRPELGKGAGLYNQEVAGASPACALG